MVFSITLYIKEVLIMDDIEAVVKKYLGDEELLFEGNGEVSGIKIAKGQANAALFVNEFDDMKISILDPGMKVMIVLPNRDYYVLHPYGKDWRPSGKGFELIEWSFSPASGILKETVIKGNDKKENKFRAYTPSEIKDKLKSLNFKVNAVFTDVDSEKYNPEQAQLYIFAEKLEGGGAAPEPEEVELEDIAPEDISPEEVKPYVPEEEKKSRKAAAAAVGAGVGAGVASSRASRPREDEEIMVPRRTTSKSRATGMPRGVYGLRLWWIDSNKKEHEVEIDKDIIIGRGRGDVLTIVNKMGKKKYTPMMVFDYKKKISRKHVEITTKDGQWYIKDLGSTNGTALNGTMLSGWKKPSGGNRYPSDEVLLRDGDIITLANTITLQVNVYLKEEFKEQEQSEPVEMNEEKYEYEPAPKHVERVAPAVAATGAAASRKRTRTRNPQYEVPEVPKKREAHMEEVAIEEDESGMLIEEPSSVKVEEEPAPPCMLKWVDGNLRPHEIEISDDVYIGKRPDNNVVFLKTRDGKVTIPLGIIDLEDEISEKHLELHHESGKWFIKDLGSERGTIVGGDYLPGWKKGKESEYVELKDNDEILIGKYLITVRMQ